MSLARNKSLVDSIEFFIVPSVLEKLIYHKDCTLRRTYQATLRSEFISVKFIFVSEIFT